MASSIGLQCSLGHKTFLLSTAVPAINAYYACMQNENGSCAHESIFSLTQH